MTAPNNHHIAAVHPAQRHPLVMAHYDAAGGGLDRFQPIVTPTSYPGNHYDSTVGIALSQGDKEGFADRFWGRGVDSRDSSGNGRP